MSDIKITPSNEPITWRFPAKRGRYYFKGGDGVFKLETPPSGFVYRVDILPEDDELVAPSLRLRIWRAAQVLMGRE